MLPLSQICTNVLVKPQLQPLSSESLSHHSDDHARLDISTRGFLNPLAKSHFIQTLPSCYRHKNEEKRVYDERVHNVEHGTFALLVFSAAGDMGPIATTFYKCLASLLSNKSNQSYNQTIRWLCWNLSFSLLRSLIMCLRGACSSGKPQLAAGDISLALNEASF